MRDFFPVFFLCFVTLNATSQAYWQQEVNYTIDVTLHDKEHTLSGYERIEYINHSPDTLYFIWFHLWPNAYKNDKTAFSDQLLENGKTGFYFSGNDEKGYINRLDFKINLVTARIEDHPQHSDIIKVYLHEPLTPGSKVFISTPFNVKLPYNYSRGGHDGQSYQATQWYPKPAVYDKHGWHPMPYLDQGEFYSEFGSYDVRITLPSNYVVAATGELQDEQEKTWLAEKLKQSKEEKEKLSKITPTSEWRKKIRSFPPSSPGTKTVHFKQSRVHDFAWFADKRFLVEHDTIHLGSGRIINAYTYYTSEYYQQWKNSVQFTKDAIHHYSSHVGEYPYNVVSVVQGPESFGGGMEYPTITIISPSGSAQNIDNTIAHEVGHNWFYGILATNERAHAWMDEGINSFYDDKYYASKYGQRPQLERIYFETTAINHTSQPISVSSEKFSETNYYLAAYYKTAEWMRYLESVMGKDTLQTAMQEYYRRWQFRHPQPSDLKAVLEEISGENLDAEFALLDQPGLLPNHGRSGTRAGVIFKPGYISDYLKNPSRNLITIGPAVGFNSYDKFMAGAFITNLKLPPSAFQFLLVPLYGTGSNRLNGIGNVSYSFYPVSRIKKVQINLSATTFTMNRFTPDSGSKVYMSFDKIVPSIKLTLSEKDPRSTRHRYIQFKSFLIGEDGLRFSRDSIFNPPDTIVVDKYSTARENRTLHQLRLVLENNRALYPYRGELRVEQATDFIRAAFTGNYFFNYPKEGGLNVRLFGGKFFYTGTKTIFKQFATDRYHLNMTGANGLEDYTYSDYFVGRNQFEGFASQQIMLRDGAFKVRTDLLADKVGRTDDWLMAANFTTSIPAGLNPLSVLPIKIPLKVFLDIGTHAEAWKEEAETDRFLYDAGLQISILRETVHFYLPLIYSNVFKDYIQSTIPKKGRIWKTVSFTIDISNFSSRRIDRNLDF